MKYILACILFLFLCLSTAIAQDSSIQFNPDKSGVHLDGKPSNWRSIINADEKTHRTIITLADQHFITHYLTDSSFQVLKLKVADRDSLAKDCYGKKYELIHQRVFNGKFYNYFQLNSGSDIIQEEIDFSSDTFNISTYLEPKNREKFITSFESDGSLFFVTLIKRTNKLIFYKDGATDAHEVALTMPVNIPDFDFEQALKGINVIKQDKETTLEDASSKVKLYVGNKDQLVLTIDKQYQFTLFFNINLHDFTSTSKIYYKNLFYCNGNTRPEFVQSNSYVYKNQLFQGVLGNRDLLIEIKDTRTDSLLQQYHASRDSGINFASSELIRKEEGEKKRTGLLLLNKWKEDYSQEVKTVKTKQFFRAIGNSVLSMSVTEKDNYLLLKIGESHDLIATGGGGGMTFASGGGSINTPGGVVSMPMTVHTIWSPAYATDMGKIETYFKSCLQPGSLEFLGEKDVDTKADKVGELLSHLERKQSHVNAFEFNGRTRLFYYDGVQKYFVITPMN